mmetsp:Transcript_30777/g.31288  ORF Transcript_30777/g.31288 Transcript_30777/m.31288 type:complete len:92 (-) Transcript_30777:149-424(-)
MLHPSILLTRVTSNHDSGGVVSTTSNSSNNNNNNNSNRANQQRQHRSTSQCPLSYLFHPYPFYQFILIPKIKSNQNHVGKRCVTVPVTVSL